MTAPIRWLIAGVTVAGALLLLAAALARPQPAAAQPVSPVARGEALAQRLCASCHSIKPQGTSQHAQAPPFRELPKRYPVTHLAEALAEGIVVAHKDMPQFTLDPPEIDALLSFMQSLAPDAPGR